mmetsp:Transcript_19065/g.48544  ORF Transcript_19065/g.48544 Transcript_19065/m.48544 type:complete len:396 (+) Transcript_19065:2224-3411(+)
MAARVAARGEFAAAAVGLEHAGAREELLRAEPVREVLGRGEQRGDARPVTLGRGQRAGAQPGGLVVARLGGRQRHELHGQRLEEPHVHAEGAQLRERGRLLGRAQRGEGGGGGEVAARGGEVAALLAAKRAPVRAGQRDGGGLGAAQQAEHRVPAQLQHGGHTSERGRVAASRECLRRPAKEQLRLVSQALLHRRAEALQTHAQLGRARAQLPPGARRPVRALPPLAHKTRREELAPPRVEGGRLASHRVVALVERQRLRVRAPRQRTEADVRQAEDVLAAQQVREGTPADARLRVLQPAAKDAVRRVGFGAEQQQLREGGEQHALAGQRLGERHGYELVHVVVDMPQPLCEALPAQFVPVVYGHAPVQVTEAGAKAQLPLQLPLVRVVEHRAQL